MEEKQKCKECWNCGNYGDYYTKGFCHFDKTKQGSCSKHREIKEKHDSCEFWRKNSHSDGQQQWHGVSAVSKKWISGYFTERLLPH